MEVIEETIRGICTFPWGHWGDSPIRDTFYEWESELADNLEETTELLKQVCRDEATAELYR